MALTGCCVGAFVGASTACHPSAAACALRTEHNGTNQLRPAARPFAQVSWFGRVGVSLSVLAAAVAARVRRRQRGLQRAASTDETSEQVDESVSWLALGRQVVGVALPNAGSFCLQLMNEQTNVIFLGQTVGDQALAAAGLGNMMQNCVGLSVAWGLLGAMDTLVSQAHGSGQDEAACAYFQRGRVIATLQLLWICPVLFCTEGILVAMGQDPGLSRMAAAYNRASAPALFCFFQFQATAKFLQNRCITVPPMLINLLCSILHVGWCSFFVLGLRLDNFGAGLANAATWTCQWFLISCYIACASERLALPRMKLLGVQRTCVEGWRQYLRVGLPCVLQISSEWWFWEVCALVVGYLGTVSLAAHVAALQIVVLVFMPSIGIAAAGAALVGNALGAGEGRKARRLVALCIGINLASWTTMALGMVFGRGQLARIYLREGEAAKLMQVLVVIFAFAGFADSSQNVMAGILRGMGRPGLASTVYILAYYGVMLPLGCFWAFKGGHGVQGLWWAFAVGTSMAVVVFGTALFRTRFSELAERISRRKL